MQSLLSVSVAADQNVNKEEDGVEGAGVKPITAILPRLPFVMSFSGYTFFNLLHLLQLYSSKKPLL